MRREGVSVESVLLSLVPDTNKPPWRDWAMVIACDFLIWANEVAKAVLDCGGSKADSEAAYRLAIYSGKMTANKAGLKGKSYR
jgi:hypothetical protein